MTDEQLESNYLEAQARRVVNWLRGHDDLSGQQRAILAALGQAIVDALQADAPETKEATG